MMSDGIRWHAFPVANKPATRDLNPDATLDVQFPLGHRKEGPGTPDVPKWTSMGGTCQHDMLHWL